jgi:hypothetical protein
MSTNRLRFAEDEGDDVAPMAKPAPPPAEGRLDLDYTPESPAPERSRPEYLEIDTGWRKRWLGLAGFLLAFLLVATILVYLFMQFTASLALGIGLVLFMIAYMAVMGYVAGRTVERRE